MKKLGHICVDLDRTLAHYESGDFKSKGVFHIGAPIPNMVQRVREYLNAGREIRIFTARYSKELPDARLITEVIQDWCEQHIQPGLRLQVTNEKVFETDEIWDDRARQCLPNTGILVGEGYNSSELVIREKLGKLLNLGKELNHIDSALRNLKQKVSFQEVWIDAEIIRTVLIEQQATALREVRKILDGNRDGST